MSLLLGAFRRGGGGGFGGGLGGGASGFLGGLLPLLAGLDAEVLLDRQEADDGVRLLEAAFELGRDVARALVGEEDRPERSERGPYRKYFAPKKKFCRFCQRNVRTIDYKAVEILKKYIPDRGKISPRRVTGPCAFHQRKLSLAVKRARLMALLPYVED